MHGKLKTLVDVLLSFFTALSLFASAVCFLLCSTVCSDSFLLSRMERSGFYESNFNEFRTELTYLAEPIGIDPARLEEVLLQNHLRQDVDESIRYSFREIAFTPDSTSFETGIHDALAAYAKEKDAAINEENLQNISQLCGELYREHATLSYVGSLGHYANLFRTPLLVAALVCAAMGIILICIQFSIHHYKHRALRYVICGLSGAGLSLSVFPAIVLLSGKIRHLSITDESLYRLVVTYLNTLLNYLVITGAACLCVSLLLGLVYRRIHPARRHARRHGR